MTLVAVVCMPADRPAIAASCNKDLARIQVRCNHCCMILNPNQSKVLVVSWSGTDNPLQVDLVLSGVSIHDSPNLDILGMKFDGKLIFEDNVQGIVSHVCQRIGILRLVKQIFVETSVLLHCYYAFVLPILKYCSLVGGSAGDYHLQLLQC